MEIIVVQRAARRMIRSVAGTALLAGLMPVLTPVLAPVLLAGLVPSSAQAQAVVVPAASGAIGAASPMRPTATLGPAPGQGAATGAAAPLIMLPGASANPASGANPAAGGVPPQFPGIPRFLSVSRPNVILYDAPSDKARRLFLAPAGMPVEVVSVLREWVKIRDAMGDLTWVLRDDLTDRRMVVASSVAPLRREPQPMAPTWFDVDQGVVLELLDDRPTNGFVRVKYVEGQIGWLLPAQVWGL